MTMADEWRCPHTPPCVSPVRCISADDLPANRDNQQGEPPEQPAAWTAQREHQINVLQAEIAREQQRRKSWSEVQQPSETKD